MAWYNCAIFGFSCLYARDQVKRYYLYSLKIGSILDKTAEEIAEQYGPIVKAHQKKKDANNLFVAANKIFFNKDYCTNSQSNDFLHLSKKYYGENSLEVLEFAQAEALAMVYFYFFLVFGIVELWL